MKQFCRARASLPISLLPQGVHTHTYTHRRTHACTQSRWSASQSRRAQLSHFEASARRACVPRIFRSYHRFSIALDTSPSAYHLWKMACVPRHRLRRHRLLRSCGARGRWFCAVLCRRALNIVINNRREARVSTMSMHIIQRDNVCTRLYGGSAERWTERANAPL